MNKQKTLLELYRQLVKDLGLVIEQAIKEYELVIKQYEQAIKELEQLIKEMRENE